MNTYKNYKINQLDELAASEILKPVGSRIIQFLIKFKSSFDNQGENTLNGTTFITKLKSVTNPRDYLNFIYQINLLDKPELGEYCLTKFGDNIINGELMFEQIFAAIEDVYQNKKEKININNFQRHTILLLYKYSYTKIIEKVEPNPEDFRLENEEPTNTYYNRRFQLAKEFFNWLDVEAGKRKHTCFFNDWVNFLNH